MSFPDAVRSGLQNYVNFSGRARRSEYWYLFLFQVIVLVVARILDSVIGTAPLLYLVAALALFLPVLGAGIRRMHDTNRSGWWILLPIVNIIFLASEGTPGDNQYGPNPTAAPTAYSG
jgi:uncharacterized membrane protein YhaH (DUF805 family)